MHTSGNSSRSLRRLLSLAVVLTTAAVMLAAGSPARAAEPLPACNGVLAATKQVPGDTDPSFCAILERRIGHLDAGQAVTVAANVKVDDSAVALNKKQRAFLNAEINCFVDDGTTSAKAFGTNAVRNVYTGMTPSGVYPRSVLIAKVSGDYRCVLDARQYDVSSTTAPRSWQIASASLSSASASFGASTRGPNLDGWPSTVNNVTSAGESAGTGVSVAQLDVSPRPGTSAVSVTASVPLSTCAYHRPDENACWPAGASQAALDSATPFVATVRLYAAQRTSPTDASFCGQRVIADYPVRVDELAHHFTATATEVLMLSPQCTGRVTIKTELHDVSGRGYVGTPGPDRSTPGKSYQNSIGATWN